VGVEAPLKELRKSVRSAIESKSRFMDAATKAESGQRQNFERIADAYHSIAKDLIREMNHEAGSGGPKNRFRELDPKK